MISASEFCSEGYPVFGGNGFRGFTNKWNTEANTIIIGRYGALCGNVRLTDRRIWATEHALRVIPLASFDTLYFTYLIDSLDLNRLSARTAQPGLNSDMVRNNTVAVPPIPEQRAITAFLDRETGRIDRLIEKKQRQVELLQEKRTALISHAVTKGLDPNAKMKGSGIEWLGEIPTALGNKTDASIWGRFGMDSDEPPQNTSMMVCQFDPQDEWGVLKRWLRE